MNLENNFKKISKLAPKKAVALALIAATLISPITGSIGASAIFGLHFHSKNSSRNNTPTPTPEVDDFDFDNNNTLDNTKFKEVFIKTFDSATMSKLDNGGTLPKIKTDENEYDLDGYLSDENKKAIENSLQINFRFLDKLADELLRGTEERKTEIIEDICNYFIPTLPTNSTLYDPQKRFALSYLIYKSKNESLFELGEKINQKILSSALMPKNTSASSSSSSSSSSTTSGRLGEQQKALLRLLFFAHLGNAEFNYGKSNTTHFPEYASSLFAYGETVMTTLPLNINKITDEYITKNIFGYNDTPTNDNNDNGTKSGPGQTNTNKKIEYNTWTKRVSTHDIGFEDTSAVERKLSIWENISNTFWFMCDKAFYTELYKNQKGIDIEILKPPYDISTTTTARISPGFGHLLASYKMQNQYAGLFTKVEDRGPQQTSSFGHTHGPSGGTNLISAFCQHRIFSPHKYRNGVAIDLRRISFEDFDSTLMKFNGLLNHFETLHTFSELSSKSQTDFIYQLTGPIMDQEQLNEFCKDYGLVDSGKRIEKTEGIPLDVVDSLLSTIKYEGASSSSSGATSYNDSGVVLFEDSKSKKYTYYIINQSAFNDFCMHHSISEDDKTRIMANVGKPLFLDSETSGVKNILVIEGLNKDFYTLINERIKDTSSPIPDILLQQTFSEKGLEDVKSMFNLENSANNSADESADESADKVYSIRGVKIYRYKGTCRTYYGYIIEDLDSFHDDYEDDISSETGNELSTSFNKIIAAQNCWLYTSDSKATSEATTSKIGIVGNALKAITNTLKKIDGREIKEGWNIYELPKPFLKKLLEIKNNHKSEDHKSKYVENIEEVPNDQWTIKPDTLCSKLNGFDQLPVYSQVKDKKSSEFISDLGTSATLDTLWDKCGINEK